MRSVECNNEKCELVTSDGGVSSESSSESVSLEKFTPDQKHSQSLQMEETENSSKRSSDVVKKPKNQLKNAQNQTLNFPDQVGAGFSGLNPVNFSNTIPLGKKLKKKSAKKRSIVGKGKRKRKSKKPQKGRGRKRDKKPLTGGKKRRKTAKRSAVAKKRSKKKGCKSQTSFKKW